MAHWFEEFEAGFRIATAGRTIGEGDVMQFAGLTGDCSELHTNEEYARTTRFGRRIAHGALVFGLSVGLTTRTNVLDGTLVAFSRVDNLRFTKPVFLGDTIHVIKRVIEAVPKTDETGLVAFDTRVFNQRGEVVLAYVDRLLVKRRGGEADDLAVSHLALRACPE
jgi:acyl dehydratase